MKTFVLFLMFASSLFAASPIGESADYQIDQNPKRTTPLIRSGSLKVSVLELLENSSGSSLFRVALDSVFITKLFGKQQGRAEAMLETEFFTAEFMEALRKSGTYRGKYFTAQHLGFADVSNLDGKTYAHCDKVFLTDIKPPQDPGHQPGIDNLKVTAYLAPGIPVLGAVKLDIVGTYMGTPIKAGGDYLAK